MRYPKSIFFLFFIILLNNCGDKVEEIQTIGEYDVPMDPEVVERIYTYVRRPSDIDYYGGDTLVYKIIPIAIGTDSIRNRYWQVIKENSVTVGERVYEINNNRKKLISEYVHENDEKMECEILQYEAVNVGHRFPGLKCKTKYINHDGTITTNYEEEHKITDITITFQGKERKALEVDYTQITKEKMKYLPFIVHTYEYDGKATYVEGIGLYKWILKWKNVEYETKLLSMKVLRKSDLVSTE